MSLRIMTFIQIPLIIPRQFYSEFEIKFEEDINKKYNEKTINYKELMDKGWSADFKNKIIINPNNYFKGEYREKDQSFYMVIYILPSDYMKLKKILGLYPEIKKPSLGKFKFKI